MTINELQVIKSFFDEPIKRLDGIVANLNKVIDDICEQNKDEHKEMLQRLGVNEVNIATLQGTDKVSEKHITTVDGAIKQQKDKIWQIFMVIFAALFSSGLTLWLSMHTK